METVSKPKEKNVEKKKSAKKKYKLIDFFGCFEGQISCDDAIFNLGVRQNNEAILQS